VFRPTLTGSGQRVHLASPAVDLDTHILDVVNVIRYEDLQDVILVGISSAGMVITAVAERVPERLRHLIYLDALLPQDGQSLADVVGPAVMAAMEQSAQQYGDGWRVPHDPPDADRRTDFLVQVAKQPLRIANVGAARLKHTFVRFTGQAPGGWLVPVLDRIVARVRAEEGWDYLERPFGQHWPIRSQPHEVARLLLELA
jgi:pimeloyl-ACP methyl ester carboxylesterase